MRLSFVTFAPRPGLGRTRHLNFSPASRRSNLIHRVVVSLNVPSPLGSITVEPRNVRQINVYHVTLRKVMNEVRHHKAAP